MLGRTGALVYGTVAVGALLAAEDAKRETYADTVGAVAIALLVYWLAHAYADYAEDRLDRKQPLTLDGAAHTLLHDVSLLAGAAVPLLVLLVCWAAGVRLTSAVAAAFWTSAAMIVVIEVVAGVKVRLSARALIAQAGAGAFFGVLIVAVKLLFHY